MAAFNKKDLFKDIYAMFLNIATYVITGVLITSFFADMSGGIGVVYITGVAVSLGAVVIAVLFLFLSQKE
jgi:archaellum biogenesis protein FlaJ (TadC family)